MLDKLVRRGFLRPLPVKIDADGNVFQTRVLQLTAKGRSHRLPDDPLGPAAASPEASRTRKGSKERLQGILVDGLAQERVRLTLNAAVCRPNLFRGAENVRQ